MYVQTVHNLKSHGTTTRIHRSADILKSSKHVYFLEQMAGTEMEDHQVLDDLNVVSKGQHPAQILLNFFLPSPRELIACRNPNHRMPREVDPDLLLRDCNIHDTQENGGKLRQNDL